MVVLASIGPPALFLTLRLGRLVFVPPVSCDAACVLAPALGMLIPALVLVALLADEPWLPWSRPGAGRGPTIGSAAAGGQPVGGARKGSSRQRGAPMSTTVTSPV
jgi:hypothetical protein